MLSNSLNTWYRRRVMPTQASQSCVPGIAANDAVWPLVGTASQGTMTRAAAAETVGLAGADECRSGSRMSILVARWSFEVPDRSAADPGAASSSASAGAERTLGRHSVLRTLLWFVADWRTRSADRRCLSVLDDHILTDIGFTRDDANRPVWQPFGRR